MTELSFEVARRIAASVQGFGRRPRARACGCRLATTLGGIGVARLTPVAFARLGAALATLVALVVAPRPAEASPDETPATIELRYVVAKGIAGCFSEAEFRDAVQTRLAD